MTSQMRSPHRAAVLRGPGALIALIVALGGHATHVAAQATPARPAGAPDPRREWQLRVPFDSGEVQVEVTTAAAAVTIIAPTGTFVQAFSTAAPLATWADAMAALPVPGSGVAAPSGRDDGSTGDRPVVAGLAGPADTARRFDLTEFQLVRLADDGAAAYQLTGTNGAWSFALRLTRPQWAALAAALRGDSTAGAVALALPSLGRSPADATPDVTGAWLNVQVDQPAHLGPRPPRPGFPGVLLGMGIAGAVRLQFVIDANGLVRPSSVRLIGKARPAFALAARDALLDAQYTPAIRGGRPVPQIIAQTFDFQ